MAVSQRKLNEMYERVLACLDAEFDDLPRNSGGELAAQGLRDAFAVIRTKGSEQEGFSGSARAGTGARSISRFNIRHYRSKLSDTANIIARKKPGFNQHFPPPSGETDDELITNTRAITVKALEHQADFIRCGLDLEFLSSGTALLTTFEELFDTTNEALSHRGAAVGSKKSAYREADENFDELDIFIRNHYHDQPDKLNAWNIASRIERSAEKKDVNNG